MTLAEFNAWLDGYSESFGDAPTAEQWAKIRAKLAEVRFVPVYHGSPPTFQGIWGPSPPVTCGNDTFRDMPSSNILRGVSVKTQMVDGH